MLYKPWQNKTGVLTLISARIDFRTRNIVRDIQSHYVMIKGSIFQEDMTILNNYHLLSELRNIFKGQIELKKKKKCAVMVRDFNTLLLSTDTTSL